MKELFGLIVCGGESSRMGMDKSLMVYHDQPQRYHLYTMLQPLCDRVFISCNKKQAPAIPPEYEQITDLEEYENIGPMAALLSAFSNYPDNDFLVIACDYPFLTVNDLQHLLDARKPAHPAVSFFNTETQMKEPLLAVYSNACHPELIRHFDRKEYSLRQFLQDMNAEKVKPSSAEILTSVDTPEAYHEALRLLQQLKNRANGF
jgi:molybdopterin-guanine dinucleotide biosynthesis protein A